MAFYSSEFNGLTELSKDLEKYISSSENPQQILEIAAKEFVKDLLKLPKPISEIKKSGYTHLIETFCYELKNNGDIDVGWGKYYGKFVEDGTTKMKAQPHLVPTFEKNKDKYYRKMLEKYYK